MYNIFLVIIPSVYFSQIQDLVGYLKPYHVYPNVPPAGLETLEDAFERYSTLANDLGYKP